MTRDEYNDKVAEVLHRKNRIQPKSKEKETLNNRVISEDQQEHMENMIKCQQYHQTELQKFQM